MPLQASSRSHHHGSFAIFSPLEVIYYKLKSASWSFEGIEKGSKVYTFKNDLSFKEYLNKLEEVGFKVQNLYIWMKRWNKNDYCKEKRNYPTAKPVNIMDLISY